ncbi:hypothetical protein INR49_004041, partial [Caranx melampygus]
MNGEREGRRKEGTLRSIAPDYTFMLLPTPKIVGVFVARCSVSLSVFLVSVAFVVCAIWLVALCGVCTWCQRKLSGSEVSAATSSVMTPLPEPEPTAQLEPFNGVAPCMCTCVDVYSSFLSKEMNRRTPQGKRNKPGVEAASSPDSVRGRGENKAINGAVDKGGQGGAGPSPGASDSGGGACSGSGAGPSRSDSVRSMVTGGSKAGRWQTVQSHMHAGGLRFGNFGDASLSTASTLEHIPSSAVARPRPLVRQQSLQQPLTHQPPPGPNDPPVTSQSLGQLHTGPGGGGHRGGPRGVRGSPAGASRYRGGGAGRSSEGKMVVLSLAIGLAEQDDFANLPDLQEAPASKENETTPEKSYPVSSLRPSAGSLLAVFMEPSRLRTMEQDDPTKNICDKTRHCQTVRDRQE